MSGVRWLLGAVLGALFLVTVPGVAQAATTAPRAPAATASLVADWEMNEPAGSTVMVDSTGAHNGAIDPGAADAGLTLNGSAYQWSLRCPACPPAALPRVVQVPDSSALDIPDPNVTWSAEFRFKTNKGFGNIMQKGQATDVGGQIKIENPNGYTQCVFVGANKSYIALASPIRLNDNQWHDFKCVHMAKQIQVWVDGVEVAVRNFVTGPIDNARPFIIGGKSRCDNVNITCDYYTGAIDWVKITRGDGTPTNQPPTAAFDSACSALSCSFDGSASADPEGGALSYAWNFGDGTTSTAQSPDHRFAAEGTYPVTLTVTDPGGSTGTVTHQVTANSPSGAVSFRGGSSSDANSKDPSVTIPASVQSGDALVLVATTNRLATMTTPAGWTLLGTQTDGSDLRSWAFTRTATASSGGTKVTTSLDAISKTSLTLLAYSGAGAVTTAASAAEQADSVKAHASPPVAVASDGSWVISSWIDKSAGNPGWTLPGAVTQRQATGGTGSGVVTAVAGDSGPQASGRWNGLNATSGVASGKAIMWSIVVPPA